MGNRVEVNEAARTAAGGFLDGIEIRNGRGGNNPRGGDDMSRENKVSSVGEKAPDFELPDAETGEMVRLADLLGQPLLTYFGRGTW